MDIKLWDFHTGVSLTAYELMGARPKEENGVYGVRFTVYAPSAESVCVSGDFNGWGEDRMQRYGDDDSMWTCFVPGAEVFERYKYLVEGPGGVRRHMADPYARFSEKRPDTASVVYDMEGYEWGDGEWMKARTLNFDEPLNIYECHLLSWRNRAGLEDQRLFSYDDLTAELPEYLEELGYTHVELLPLTEHPFDGSWGYQSHGFFSATSRFGTPHQLMGLVDACHRRGIGVILDFTPVHFVADEGLLARFDGRPLYEYALERDAKSEWGTLNFDLAKGEVRSFLMSAMHFWCRFYHIDGVRFDAMANLIYWGGRKERGLNMEALEYIKRNNSLMDAHYPEVMRIAEDSTTYPKVTTPVDEGGLGFHYKWNLGWMHDTLEYLEAAPHERPKLHNKMNFTMSYFFGERYILPLSHDEVVHGKKSILSKMNAEYERKFSLSRALFLFMCGHPGKLINFMGSEIAQVIEWDEKRQLDWFLLRYPLHDSFNKYIGRLNRFYRENPACYERDYSPYGFAWIDADDGERQCYSFYRSSEGGQILVFLLNFSPVGRDVTLDVPKLGVYREAFNSDRFEFSGENAVNEGEISAYEGSRIDGCVGHVVVRVGAYAGTVLEWMGGE